MANSNGFGIVTSFRIGQSNAAKLLVYQEECSETIMRSALHKVHGIVQTTTLTGLGEPSVVK